MGAESISFTLGNVSFKDVQKHFKARQSYDKIRNGHQEGYSGDFQTVSEVKDHMYKLFDTKHDAMEYCLDKAKKWEHVVAVQYKVCKNVEPSKKVMDMQVKINQARQDLSALDAVEFKTNKFVSCKGCKSKINTLFLKSLRNCPVCICDLRPAGHVKRIERLKAKIILLIDKRMALVASDRAKALAKGYEVATLVAGWGAC